MTDCLILADDLSGAADSAVSALQCRVRRRGLSYREGAGESHTIVVAIDLNIREVNAERARTPTGSSRN